MKLKVLIFSLILLILLGMTVIKIVSQVNPMENNKRDSATQYVVFPAATQVFVSGEKIVGRWDPTAADVERAANIVAACLKQDPRGLGLENYYLQYAGIMNQAGEREVWVNAFHHNRVDDFPQWRQEIVYVEDGGQDFFESIVNLQSKTCRKLYIHGEA